MKTSRTKQETELQRKEVLYLRYGSEAPSVDNLPAALLPLTIVAKLMQLKIGRVKYLHSSYFAMHKQPPRESLFVPKYRPVPKGRARVTEANLTPEEFEYLACPENLQAWAHLSLLGRCVMFHRRFPERWLGRVTLGRILRKAGLRKKAVTVRNLPQRRTLRLEEFANRTLALQAEIEKILEQKGHLVFADEALFKARDFQMAAWSLPGQNVQVEDRTGRQLCQAVCAAVCSCHRLLTFAIEDESFTKESFGSFLEQVRDACGDEPVHLFLDNSGVHKACRAKMKELGITPVWNLAYLPEYNCGVERYWAQLKAYFRPLLLKKMLLGPRAKDTPLRDAVRQTIKEVSTASIPAFCAAGLEALRRDAAAIRYERKLQEVSVLASAGSPLRE